MIKAIIKNDDYNQNNSKQAIEDCNIDRNNRAIDEKNIIDMKENVKLEKNATTLSRLKKLKNIKHFELIIAFGVALVAIIIYFAFSTFSASPPTTFDNKEYGKDLSGNVAKLLSNIDGVGECEVLITFCEPQDAFSQQNEGQFDNIVGVVVVAKGGGDTNVKVKIVDAVSALLKVKSNCVKVYKMK